MVYSSVDYQVNPGQMEAVFGACAAQIGKIDAQASFSVYFLNEHDISQPGRIIDLPDGLCAQ